MSRHYGLDWLRIGAFALLILYHIGMAFVPWPWHVKLAQLDWVRVPMLATNAWRLPLLFLVSGYATRAVLMRSGSPGGFAWERTKRLLIPVLFAAFVIIPPQPWVELVTQHGYRVSLPTFWFGDYLRFGALEGIVLPTWQHLWFVVYLWAYTLAVAVGAALVPSHVATALDRGFARLFQGWRLIVVPIAYLIVARALLLPFPETHALVDDWGGHAAYLPVFLFGVALARAPALLAAAARRWTFALTVGLLAYGAVAVMTLLDVGSSDGGLAASVRAATRLVQGWCAIVALLGVAHRFWNRDHRWRATLGEAVFPAYIVHQTIIVVVAFALLGAGLPLWADFAVLVLATAVGCALFYLAGRSVAPLRPLIGLRAARR